MHLLTTSTVPLQAFITVLDETRATARYTIKPESIVIVKLLSIFFFTVKSFLPVLLHALVAMVAMQPSSN